MAGEDTEIRRDHRRCRPGRATAGRQADRGRSDRRGDRTQADRRHVRQLPAASRPRRWWPAPTPRTWPAAAPNTASAPATSPSTWRRSRRARTRSCSTTATASSRGWRAWTAAPLIRGHARFEGPHTIRVDGQVLEADKIFLNVGGRAVVPDMPGLADVDYLTNVSILELDTVPEHLVIIGGSYIALEFAQMYRRFGARVSVIEKGPRLTSREDEDVSAAIKEILEAEGIDVFVGADRHSIAKRDNGFEVDAPRGRDADRRHASAAGGRAATQHRRPRPGARRGRDRRPRLHRRRRPAAHQRRAHLGDGRLQRHAARSPTPRTTTSRSSPPTCSTTTRVG